MMIWPPRLFNDILDGEDQVLFPSMARYDMTMFKEVLYYLQRSGVDHGVSVIDTSALSVLPVTKDGRGL